MGFYILNRHNIQRIHHHGFLLSLSTRSKDPTFTVDGCTVLACVLVWLHARQKQAAPVDDSGRADYRMIEGNSRMESRFRPFQVGGGMLSSRLGQCDTKNTRPQQL
ncbi:predicted protein [Coccidioides posadasii str. Silveira]|uniref:Predicted protein n=1 Tax=Coccidioides posadasii (strain RMSCC 757 / Silveira) TaxID=443226 RepID=E9DCC4_COCPS|nr:predicted protein [Coccidioides posadasii str. Silveira]